MEIRPAGLKPGPTKYMCLSGVEMSNSSGKRQGSWRPPWLLQQTEAAGAGDGADPGVHFFFVLQEVAEGGFAEDVVNRDLDGAPERADGTIDRTGTDGSLAGVGVTEIAFEEAAAEGIDDVADDDGFGGTG